MAALKSPEDWWSLFDRIKGELPEYAALFGIEFGPLANEFSIARDHLKLYMALNELWGRLPDSMEIHRGPFYSLCDLISEYSTCFGEN